MATAAPASEPTALSQKAAKINRGLSRGKVISILGPATWAILRKDKGKGDWTITSRSTGLELYWRNGGCEPVSVVFNRKLNVKKRGKGNTACNEEFRTVVMPDDFLCTKPDRSKLCGIGISEILAKKPAPIREAVKTAQKKAPPTEDVTAKTAPKVKKPPVTATKEPTPKVKESHVTVTEEATPKIKDSQATVTAKATPKVKEAPPTAAKPGSQPVKKSKPVKSRPSKSKSPKSKPPKSKPLKSKPQKSNKEKKTIGSTYKTVSRRGIRVYKVLPEDFLTYYAPESRMFLSSGDSFTVRAIKKCYGGNCYRVTLAGKKEAFIPKGTFDLWRENGFIK